MAHIDIDVAESAATWPIRARSRRMPKVGLVPAATLGAIALLAGARLAGYGGSLSALAVILVSAGLLLGAIAWMRSVPREGRRATAWDVAGMLTFVGCISAMLSD